MGYIKTNKQFLLLYLSLFYKFSRPMQAILLLIFFFLVCVCSYILFELVLLVPISHLLILVTDAGSTSTFIKANLWKLTNCEQNTFTVSPSWILPTLTFWKCQHILGKPHLVWARPALHACILSLPGQWLLDNKGWLLATLGRKICGSTSVVYWAMADSVGLPGCTMHCVDYLQAKMAGGG